MMPRHRPSSQFETFPPRRQPSGFHHQPELSGPALADKVAADMFADLSDQRIKDLPLAGDIHHHSRHSKYAHLNKDDHLFVPVLSNEKIEAWNSLCDNQLAEKLEVEEMGGGASYRNGPNYNPDGRVLKHFLKEENKQYIMANGKRIRPADDVRNYIPAEFRGRPKGQDITALRPPPAMQRRERSLPPENTTPKRQKLRNSEEFGAVKMAQGFVHNPKAQDFHPNLSLPNRGPPVQRRVSTAVSSKPSKASGWTGQLTNKPWFLPEKAKAPSKVEEAKLPDKPPTPKPDDAVSNPQIVSGNQPNELPTPKSNGVKPSIIPEMGVDIAKEEKLLEVKYNLLVGIQEDEQRPVMQNNMGMAGSKHATTSKSGTAPITNIKPVPAMPVFANSANLPRTSKNSSPRILQPLGLGTSRWAQAPEEMKLANISESHKRIPSGSISGEGLFTAFEQGHMPRPKPVIMAQPKSAHTNSSNATAIARKKEQIMLDLGAPLGDEMAQVVNKVFRTLTPIPAEDNKSESQPPEPSAPLLVDVFGVDTEDKKSTYMDELSELLSGLGSPAEQSEVAESSYSFGETIRQFDTIALNTDRPRVLCTDPTFFMHDINRMPTMSHILTPQNAARSLSTMASSLRVASQPLPGRASYERYDSGLARIISKYNEISLSVVPFGESKLDKARRELRIAETQVVYLSKALSDARAIYTKAQESFQKVLGHPDEMI